MKAKPGVNQSVFGPTVRAWLYAFRFVLVSLSPCQVLLASPSTMQGTDSPDRCFLGMGWKIDFLAAVKKAESLQAKPGVNQSVFGPTVRAWLYALALCWYRFRSVRCFWLPHRRCKARIARRAASFWSYCKSLPACFGFVLVSLSLCQVLLASPSMMQGTDSPDSCFLGMGWKMCFLVSLLSFLISFYDGYLLMWLIPARPGSWGWSNVAPGSCCWAKFTAVPNTDCGVFHNWPFGVFWGP